MFFPFIAHAQSDVTELIQEISYYVLNPILSVLFGAAFIVFIWGVVEYLLNPNSDEARQKGSRHILWGLVGMLIMFSAFAILHILANTVGADADVKSAIPRTNL